MQDLRTVKTSRMQSPNHVAKYKVILFWMIDLLQSQLYIQACLKCFFLTLMMSLLKSKRLSKLRIVVMPLPSELIEWMFRNSERKHEVDVNRVVFVKKELKDEYNLFDVQWVCLKLVAKSRETFPCQVLGLPMSTSMTESAGDADIPGTILMYMTPTGLRNLRQKSGASLGVQRDKLIYTIFPLMKKEMNSSTLSIVPAKTAHLSRLSSCGDNLSTQILDKYLKTYFQHTKYVAQGDLITLPSGNAMDASLCFQVASVETSGDELVISDLALYSISTNTTSVFLQDKESNTFRPQIEHQFFSFGENTRVVSICVPCLKSYLDSLSEWMRNLTTVRSKIKSQDSANFEGKNELWPSCLLTGPIGSGKYTLAKTLARQLGLNFYSVNIVGLMGDTSAFTIAKLSAVVQKARSYSPCILFIKNVHLLGKDKEGQEDKRVTLAFLDLLDEINSLYGTNTDSDIYFIAETNKIEEILPAVSDCFIKRINITPIKESDDILQYFEWIQSQHLQIKLSFDVRSWVIDKNVKTVLKYLGDLKALLSIAVREAYIESLHSNYDGTGVSEESTSESKYVIVGEVHFNAALEHLEATERLSVGSPKVPVVTWDDVGGLAETKRELINSVQLPLRFPHLFSSGIKRSGILLYGPPGTGKTLLAKAVASEFKINFFSVKGPELLNMYVGQSEQNVREVFDRARASAPCVLFFDELDSLAPNRGRSGDSGGVMDRVVSQILAEMDGTHSSPNVFIIGATNRPDLIDPALLRPGRFDKLIYVGVSADAGAACKILKTLTRKFALSPDVNMEEISKELPEGMSGADLYAFCSDAYMTAVTRRIHLLESGTSGDQESPVEVERRDFDSALARISPSLSTNELQKYQQLKSLMR